MASTATSPTTTPLPPPPPASGIAAPTRTQSFQGSGLAILRSHEGVANTLACTFTHLYFSFPLKLITPRTSSRNATSSRWRGDQGEAEADARAVAALYIVGYGGGLVSGDCVDLNVDVGEKCTLLLLTQGSTKVFKMRGLGCSGHEPVPRTLTTRQTMRFLIQPSSTLLVLPSPVTCYQSSRYLQVQRFDVRCAHTSSLVLLDWITPGREHLLRKDERWAFESYRSRNEVRVAGRVVIRDVLLLEQDDTSSLSLAERTHPYSIYANLFLLGPTSQPLIASLQEEFTRIQQRVVRRMDNLIWSFSILGGGAEGSAAKTAVVRIAGMETDQVRSWLSDRLGALREQVGDDLYKQAMW